MLFGKRNTRGEALLKLELDGSDESLKAYLELVRADGVTDSDIKTWWDMPDSQHRELLNEDKRVLEAVASEYFDDDLLPSECEDRIRKSFALYGDSSGDVGDLHRPLPVELKPRINAFLASLGPSELVTLRMGAGVFGSMNALLREKIRIGQL